MRTKTKKHSLIAIASIILILSLTCTLTVRAQDGLARQFHILYLSSYSYSNPTVPDQLEGFKKGIEGLNVDISYEFMDSDKYYGAIDLLNFDKFLKYKVFSARNYDLVAVADDTALRYYVNNKAEMFEDLPMVFMGINNKTEATTAAAMKNTTGIAESPDFEGNYALMRTLFPDRTHFVVVLDSSIAGQGDYVEFMKFSEARPEIDYTIVNTSYYTANGLKDVLTALGNRDIILFLDFTADGDKNNYSLEHASEFLSQYAPAVPIFRVVNSNIEHGIFGGISYSNYEAGKIAGDTAKKILKGANADEMPLMTTAVTTPYFEQGCMDKFGVRYSQLPVGSTILNEHQNLARFYRENKVFSNLMLIIALLMLAIIVILILTNSRRKRVIRTDFLTQMPNRKKIIEDMNLIISQSQPYGLIMLDVDHFKDINDTYGHKVGDEVIVGVAERLKKLSDKELTFARLGGDEFCGLFTSPDNERAKEICESILDATKKPFSTSKGDLDLTVSIGCAMYPIDTRDSGTVMECADKALYRTKDRGRNGYTLFNRKY